MILVRITSVAVLVKRGEIQDVLNQLVRSFGLVATAPNDAVREQRMQMAALPLGIAGDMRAALGHGLSSLDVVMIQGTTTPPDGRKR